MVSQGWLERYERGEREEVWRELRQCGQRVREPEVVEQAWAVCDAMAHRARQNVDVVIERLRQQGYRFHTNDDARNPVAAHLPPGPGVDIVESWLETNVGPAPMAVLSWLRVVGNVWLVGTHPDWPEAVEVDPLVVELEGSRYADVSMAQHLDAELEAWQESHEGEDDLDVFVLPVSPDRVHKANVSGGPPYGIQLPDATAEGLFMGEVAMPFVAYLNWVFAYGGFPGRTPGGEQWRIKQGLAQDLLPL